jgi:hypothetical protein
MKKVMLLVLTVMLISAFLMASGPRLKIVKLTIINKSGNEVMMKLEGSDVGKQFYYLTIPAGDKEWPTVKVFTVLEDVYTRTTWYGEGENAICTGLSSSGVLVMDRQNRLTFTTCYAPPLRIIQAGADTPIVCIEGNEFYNPDKCKDWENLPDPWTCKVNPTRCEFVSSLQPRKNNGEPSQEKVVYFEYVNLSYGVGKDFNWYDEDLGELRSGQLWVGWDEDEVEIPDLVQWRYGY